MKLEAVFKKVAAALLLLLSFAAFVLTWRVGLLSPLGGLCAWGWSLLAAVLMWRDSDQAGRTLDG